MTPAAAQIPGYPGYTIFSDGTLLGPKGWKKAYRRPDGYFVVSLSRGGKGTTKRIHRLVAAAFIPNPKGKREVNHIDCDKSNNAAVNLEWVSSSENKIHSYRFGSKEAPWKGIRGYANPHAQEVIQILPDGSRQNFGSVRLAADAVGCDHGSISRAARGLRKTAGGFRWEYAQNDEASA